MGRSCIRLNRKKEIPNDLIGQLTAKISIQEWIETYEKAIPKQLINQLLSSS
jgi:hypothetical protein